MLDGEKSVAKSAAEQRAMFTGNPLALIGLDTLWAVGYKDGYDTEPFIFIDFTGAKCLSYIPNPDLL
jgi:hypothetical protein